MIDLTVSVDSALAIDNVDIAVRAPAKAPLHLTRAVTSSIVVNIFTDGLASGDIVTLEVSGIKGGVTLVVARAKVAVILGRRVPATVRLTASCAGILTCDANQTCENGQCVAVAIPGDAGMPGTADGAAGRGATDGSQADIAGSGGVNGQTGGVTGQTGGAGMSTGGAGMSTGGGGAVAVGGRGVGGTTVGTGGMGVGGMTVATGGRGIGGTTVGTGGAVVGTGGTAVGGMTAATGGRGTGGVGTGGRGTGGTGACASGSHDCSGTCLPNNSVTSCGSSCLTSCPVPPANGSATCDGTNCGIACVGGYRNCAGTPLCVSTTAAGACCASSDCTAGGTGTTGTCTSNVCSYACTAPTYRTCGTVCILAALPNCCTSADCPAATPVCNTTTHRCAGKALGTACTGGTECASGNCVDGACCSTSSCGTCMRCNLNAAGTCSPAPNGTAEPACATLAATAGNCTQATCDATGKCAARPTGTICGTVCSNGTDGVVAGQWFTPVATVRNKKCNGTAAATGCLADNVAPPTLCGPGLTCADAATCRTSCINHSDCIFNYYCDAGTCTHGKDLGVPCSSNFECGTKACTGTQAQGTPHCEVCNFDVNICPLLTPTCQLAVGAVGCVACRSFDPGCINGDGSINCRTGTCPANAPDCTADNHCGCGTGPQCPYAGQVCASGQCKMGGGWPCVTSADCAYGTCGSNGLCTLSRAGSLCMANAECASGACNFPGGMPGKCM